MTSTARILIAEDERIVALDLAQQLRDMGYDIIALVASGESAVEKALQLSPDLILMDIHLAGDMDGVSAATALTEKIDAPVLYVTAYADEETLARAKITEPYGYVIKPVDSRELQIAVQVSLQLHRSHIRLQTAEAEARRQAKQLSQALQALEQLENLKRQFVQNTSHELRTPLALVLGYAEMLAGGDFGVLSPGQQTAMEVIARRANELRIMIEDLNLLLEVSEQRMERMPVELSALLERVVAEWQTKAELSGLTFSCDIESSLPIIMAHPIQLYRVFGHLLSNAIKFTPVGGTISLTGCRTNGHAEVSVVDTGVGIPAEAQDLVFQRFYQVDGGPTRRYPGMGIGLAIVKETVESLGGDVSMVSKVGQGSRFRVRLPVHQPESSTSHQEDTRADEEPCLQPTPLWAPKESNLWTINA